MAKILVIEDDPSLQELLQSTLEDEGHEVLAASEGNEAIELFRNQEFDLVITDVRLPGLDGVEVLRRLEKIQKKIRCIVITGYASEDVPIRSMRLGVHDYLFKPFSLRYFLKSVERVLESREEGSPWRSLFRRIFSWFDDQDKELERIVLRREGVFQGLYVGIRSGFLSNRAALEIYSELEHIDPAFRALLNDSSPSTKEIQRVQECFDSLHDRLMQHEKGLMKDPERATLIEQVRFDLLFEAVKNNEISIEDLQYAPLLRTTLDERFETLTELHALKQRLWPTF